MAAFFSTWVGGWVGGGGLKVTHLSTPTPSVTKAAVKLSREDPGGRREKEIKLVPFGVDVTETLFVFIHHFIFSFAFSSTRGPVTAFISFVPFIQPYYPHRPKASVRTASICPSERPSTLFSICGWLNR